MSNPVSLTVNGTETLTTSSILPESSSLETPVTEATFAGLLQDKVTELEIPFEQLMSESSLIPEHVSWQNLPINQTEYGNALPDVTSNIQTELLIAWQQPVETPLTPGFLTQNMTLATTPAASLEGDAELMLINQKFSTNPVTLQQQNQNMENMVKAFIAIQAEPVVVESQYSVTNIDVEQPSMNTMPSALSANSSSQVRTDLQLQPITIPPNRPEWGNAMGERLQWMANNKIQAAEIRLDPPELGSIEIKIVIHKDTAQVSFVSPHAQVRDAVENAMPKLREMFSETGLSLGDVNVSQESFKQQTNDGNESNTNLAQSNTADDLAIDGTELESSISAQEMTSRGSGLLDTYV